MLVLIYCAGGNSRYAQIALQAGFRYGARLPDTVYHPLYFADQDYRRPDRARYMAALAKHRPAVATVLDWQREEQLPEVLNWAEEVAAHVTESIVIVPKVPGGLHRLPRMVGGRRVVLGYSVPTRYGGTDVPLWELAGWPLHLLGGSPDRQLQVWHHVSNVAEVISADGNMAQRQAGNCQFWAGCRVQYQANSRRWPTLRESGDDWGHDAPYEAFRRSCVNIMAAWRRLAGGDGCGHG